MGAGNNLLTYNMLKCYNYLEEKRFIKFYVLNYVL
jgi:hypothetical protein